MKLFMFLDDWMIEGMRDVVREWNVAKPADAPPYTHANGYVTAWYDPEIKKYRCMYNSWEGEVPENNVEMWKEPDICRTEYLAESDDGYNFVPFDHGGPTDLRYPEKKNSLRFPLRENYKYKTSSFHSCTLDEHASDPAHRFKAAGEAGAIFTSPDAITWKLHPEWRWLEPDKEWDSDMQNNLVYNPVTGKYMIFCRRGNLDRRVAITESEDLKQWTPRKVILQPDVFDPPLLQFYSLVVSWYEDMFIGLLREYRVQQQEPVYDLNVGGIVKMLGWMHNTLAYSYDGLYWLRGPRTPILPLAELGEFGCAGHYGSSILVGPDNVMRLYSKAIRVEHGDIDNQKKFWASGEGDGALRVYNIRKDGFACMSSIGTGYLRTRGLIPKDGDLKINFQAPLGWVKVQLSKSNGEPYEGFTFDDSIPMQGDELEATPQWKSGKNLDELTGKWLRIEFEMFQAKLYAYRWDCTLHYALKPQERI